MKHVFKECYSITDRVQQQAAVCVTKEKVDCERGTQQATLTNIWKHHGLQLSRIHTGCDTYTKYLQVHHLCVAHQHSVLYVEQAVITM